MVLETISTSRAFARIEAEIARAATVDRLVLATDADGTLWEGDIGIDTFEALLEARAVRDAARGMLAEEARALGVDTAGDANALARRLYDVYLADRYPLDRAFAMMALAWAGFREEEMRAFVSRVFDDKALRSRARPAMERVIAWAREKKLAVWVVSASPIVAVRCAVEIFEIDPARVVAMHPSTKEGVLGASLDGPIVYGAGKIAALERALPGASIVAAFGDSAYDAAMLREAKVPLLVAPSEALREEAITIPGAALLDLG